MSGTAAPSRLLIADDDPVLRQFLERALGAAGYEIVAVSDGQEAIQALDGQPFDLLLSDIDMPGYDGVALLREVRRRDLDLPVVLMTGNPRLDTAIAAVEHGASHYLTKPIELPRLHAIVRRSLNAHAFARARRNLVAISADTALPVGDLAGLSASFDDAVAAAFVAYQPIVTWSGRQVYAYEALVRSQEPRLANPAALFDAADRLNRTVDIGRRVRTLCGDEVAASGGLQLFVNLHTSELLDDGLYQPDTALARHAPRVVLEITERARLDSVADAATRIEQLRGLGYRIAIDDIGAGYAGLTSFVVLEPDFVKLDRLLVQHIDASRSKMAMVGAMIQACQELGVQVIGEGVETVAERDALIALGCDLLQGYLFARPATEMVSPPF